MTHITFQSKSTNTNTNLLFHLFVTSYMLATIVTTTSAFQQPSIYSIIHHGHAVTQPQSQSTYTFTFTSKKTKSTSTSSTAIYGAFNRKNKQGELLKKMEIAKEQARQREMASISKDDDVDNVDSQKNIDKKTASAASGKRRLSDEEMKKINDMKRFEELLNRESATVNYDLEGGGGTNYLTQAQEEEEVNAAYRGTNRIFEGDPAPVGPFEDLISIKSENALGSNGAKRIVPWMHKSSSKHKDYVIVITDPRSKSLELRNAMKSLSKGLTSDILGKVIVINADTPKENMRWVKKNQVPNLEIFSDEKREWMREYTALGEKRWSMCMFILADGRVQRLVRELDLDSACTVVKNAVRSLNI